jgi:hypothetical protein
MYTYGSNHIRFLGVGDDNETQSFGLLGVVRIAFLKNVSNRGPEVRDISLRTSPVSVLKFKKSWRHIGVKRRKAIRFGVFVRERCDRENDAKTRTVPYKRKAVWETEIVYDVTSARWSADDRSRRPAPVVSVPFIYLLYFSRTASYLFLSRVGFLRARSRWRINDFRARKSQVTTWNTYISRIVRTHAQRFGTSLHNNNNNNNNNIINRLRP